MFQSTPAPIGAGDTPMSAVPSPFCCFNPHPLRSERVTHRGRAIDRRLQGFNPHPLRSERVTATPTAQRHRMRGFNPHPLRSERVTCHSQKRESAIKVSIHTRSDRSG